MGFGQLLILSVSSFRIFSVVLGVNRYIETHESNNKENK